MNKSLTLFMMLLTTVTGVISMWLLYRLSLELWCWTYGLMS
jgi:hypothetical protein